MFHHLKVSEPLLFDTSTPTNTLESFYDIIYGYAWLQEYSSMTIIELKKYSKLKEETFNLQAKDKPL
jgi:hypothetical protein